MGFGTCQRMWCGKCYSSDETVDFHIADLNVSNGEGDDGDRISSGWKVRKGDQLRFQCARAGDDLMVQFECDVCVFSKLFKRLPGTSALDTSKDIFTLACIRRVNLDAFWSRASSTVMANTYLMRAMVRAAELNFGLNDGTVEDPGPLTSEDHCGYSNGRFLVGSGSVLRLTQTMGHHSARPIGLLEPVQGVCSWERYNLVLDR